MTRVDAPHAASNLARSSAAEKPAPMVQLPPDEPLSEQISLQAVQLAAHLRSRQQELDHREAELNSRTARLESDARTARLWIDQHETDLALSEAELACRERNLAARFEAITENEAELAAHLQELSARDERLAKQEREVERRLARLATVEAAQQEDAPPPDAAREEELQRAAEALESRRQQLDEAQPHWPARRTKLNRFASDWRPIKPSSPSNPPPFANRWPPSTAKRWPTSKRSVERSSSEANMPISVWRRCSNSAANWNAFIARRWKSVWRLKSFGRSFRRSAAGGADSIARPHPRKLAQQYAQANAEAAEQKRSLEAIRGHSVAEHEKLAEQKRQFEQWAAACREECQQQASRLVAREQQLHHEKIDVRQQWQRWQAERLRYQIELGRLESRAGEDSPAAAS